MRGISRRALLSAAIAMPVSAMAQTPAPPDAYLYIIWPNDGARIKGAFWVRFGLRNMGVTRAGDTTAGVGHHHLLVDVNTPLDLIAVDWFRALATINPVSYLIDCVRSLIITGWDAEALALGFGVEAAVLAVALTAASIALRSRVGQG